ncbi:MAG TPA: TldD/PmbA family protein, partial [Lapillicoccus sp.]
MARLDSPQDIVEAALGAATTDGTVVIVTDRSEANLRWANSSLTTNGEMSSRSVTVIATNGSGGGASAGVVGRTVTDADAVRELVAEAEAAARSADPAPDAAPLVTPDQAGVGSDFALEPETTSVGAFAQVAADLGEAFAAGGPDRQHFGFAEQVVDSVYLGTSTGLRLRHVQPTGRLEMNAKNADWSASSYLAFTLRDPAEADVAAADADLARRLGWAERR